MEKSIVEIIKENSIKAPRDFDELQSLKDLVNYEEALSYLKDNINTYRERYIMSKLVSFDDIISIDNINQYTLKYFKNSILFGELFYKGFNIPKELSSKKILIVNHDKKIIDICGWVNGFMERDYASAFYSEKNGWAEVYNVAESEWLPCKLNNIVLANGRKTFKNESKIYVDLFKIESKYSEHRRAHYIKYDNNFKQFSISDNKLILTVKFEIEGATYYGGAWINGYRNGYYTKGYGSRIEHFSAHENVRYYFCLKTNKFLCSEY